MAAIQDRSKPQAKLFVGTAKDEAGNKLPKDWQSQTLADVRTEKVEALAQDLNQRPFKSTELWKPQNAYVLNALSLQAYLDGDIEQDQLITTSIVTEMFKQFFNGYQEFEKISADNPSLGGVAKDPVEIPSKIDFLSPSSQEMEMYRSPSAGSPRSPKDVLGGGSLSTINLSELVFSPSDSSPRSPSSSASRKGSESSKPAPFDTYLGRFIERFIRMSYSTGSDLEVNDRIMKKKLEMHSEINRRIQGYLANDSVKASEKFIFRCIVPFQKKKIFGKPKKFHDIDNMPPMLARMHEIFPFMMLERRLDAMCVTVASFGLMKAIVSIANPGRVISEVPAYGKLSARDIRDLFDHNRVPINLNVHPSIVLPKSADTLFAGELGFLAHDCYHWWVKSSFQSREVEQLKSVMEYIKSIRSSQTSKMAVDQLGREEGGKEMRMGKIIWSLVDLDLLPDFSHETKIGWHLKLLFESASEDPIYLRDFVNFLAQDERNQKRLGIDLDDLDEDLLDLVDDESEIEKPTG